MTKAQAIRLARKRVRLIGFGRGEWAVYWYDEERDATWHSEHMDWIHACAYRRAALIEEALELLGFEDAGCEANNLAEKEGRWTDLLPDAENIPHGS